jgi:hypothetical protein
MLDEFEIIFLHLNINVERSESSNQVLGI